MAKNNNTEPKLTDQPAPARDCFGVSWQVGRGPCLARPCRESRPHFL